MDDLFEGDGLSPDAKVAEGLGKHRKTLKNWDSDPKMKALGWPDCIFLNGRRHRELPKVREFLRNAAAAHLRKSA